MDFDLRKTTYLTKFIENEYFESSTEGEFKFGSLSEYRGIEDLDAHRLSDYDEGTYSLTSSKTIIGGNFVTPNVHLSNLRSFHSKTTFAYQNTYDAYVFSACIGKYEGIDTEALLEKNEKLTHYIILDTIKFFEATSKLFDYISNEKSLLIARPVQYDEKARAFEMELSEIEASANGRYFESNNKLLEAIFQKPAWFNHECEFRISIIPSIFQGPISALLVKNHSEFSYLFKEAIVEHGEV